MLPQQLHIIQYDLLASCTSTHLAVLTATAESLTSYIIAVGVFICAAASTPMDL